MHPGLGRIPHFDERNLRYLMAFALEEPPPNRSISYRCGVVLDQGSTSRCVEYSWRSLINAAPIRQRWPYPDGDLYHAAQQVDPWPGDDYDGTATIAGAWVLKSRGYLSDYLWAYNVDDVRRWMQAGRGSVIVGTDWHAAMFDPDPRTGLVQLTGPLVGGHAWHITGYDRFRGLFTAKNSWGLGWGGWQTSTGRRVKPGYFRITGEDLGVLLEQQGEAVTATEVRGHGEKLS